VKTITSMLGAATEHEVVDIDLEQHLLLVKGAVPGAKNGLLMINKSSKGT